MVAVAAVIVPVIAVAVPVTSASAPPAPALIVVAVVVAVPAVVVARVVAVPALDPQQSIDMLIKQLKKTKTNGEFLMGVAKSAPMAADQGEEDYV